EAQKRAHLPGILAGEVWWCQGFSEPNAGSDLASLKTTAVREGDSYHVTGTKLWTSEAHQADFMYCLVRTGTPTRSGAAAGTSMPTDIGIGPPAGSGSKPQEGISLLLIDMQSPGITVRPILTIDGLHRTNQVFLDDVRVPIANRVGDEG